MCTHDATLAYLAGVIDSDGSICILRSSDGARRGTQVNPRFIENVSLKQVEPDAVRLLAQTFDVPWFIQKPYGQFRRAQFCIDLRGSRAAKALTALMPYLRIKRTQAELVMWLWVHKHHPSMPRTASAGKKGVAGRRLPDWVIQQRADLQQFLRQFNAPAPVRQGTLIGTGHSPSFASGGAGRLPANHR